MKVSIAVAALSAVSINAIAIALAEANPSPEAWCQSNGEACWKVTRSAEAFNDALHSSGAYKESRAADISNHPGGAAYHAKRSFEELANLVASAFPDPESLYEALQLDEHFGPDSNLTETEGEGGEIAARDEAAIDPRWCTRFQGQGCWKREATPWCTRFQGQGCWKRAVQMTPREAEANPWCTRFQGQGCWKRSDDDSAVSKREASPAFCPFGGEAGAVCYASKRDFIEADKRACEQPGEACHKARRAAEALIGAIETAEPEEVAKRGDDSEVAARWCTRFKGQGCWKRDGIDEVVARCNSPSGACTAARRDLSSMHAAARNLLQSLDAEVV